MISKIYHISDVHIRTYKRHKEYKEVFSRLFKYIDETKDENSIIFLGGDIVHSKTDMSPELVAVVSKFLKDCADLLPTILILGNHDLNLANPSRLDALTPIVESLNHPNLHFWKETGIYKLNGVSFSLFSVLGPVENWIPAEKVKGKFKIALHHGAVHNANTDLNYKIQNDSVTLDRFVGYDLGLLGDIHLQQFLNEEKTIGYSSSLLQQSYGEPLDKHGILVWDLKKKKAEFVPIKNDYGYYTFEFVDGKCLNEPKEYPKYLRIRAKYENTSKEQIQEFFKRIGKKTSISEITYYKKNNQVQSNYDSGILLKDMRDVENQNQLICDYLRETQKITNEDFLDGIRHINRVTNSTLQSNQAIIRGVTWKPKKFEFSNMFSYGENNEVDFTNFRGTYGITGQNAVGKSAIFCSLCFCLFDKTPRANKAAHILNIKKSEFTCKLNFELNGSDFFIERHGFRRDNGQVSVSVNFWMLSEHGEKIDLSGKERDDTNKIIRDYIGTYDDFVMTVLSSQVDNQSFVDKSQRERKDLLYKFLDISIFDELQRIAKDESREIQFKIKELEKIDSRELLRKTEVNLQIYRERLQGLHTQIEEIKEEIKKNQKNLSQLNKSLVSTDFNLNLDEIISRKEQISEELQKIILEIASVNESIARFKKQLEQIFIDEETLDALKKNKNEFLDASEEIRELERQEKIINREVQIRQEKIKHLQNHEFDPTCQYCIKNPFVQDAYNAEAEIEEWEEKLEITINKISNTKKTIEELREKVKELEKIEALIKTKDNLQNDLVILEERKNSILYKGKMYREQYSKILELEESYHKQEKTIEQNQLIEKEIRETERVLRDYEKDESSLQSSYRRIYSEVKIETKNEIEYKKNLEEYSSLIGKYHNYESYLKAISKEGVPYKILSLVLPVLEYEINQVLANLVDFSVRMEATDEKYIYAYIVYSDDKFWPVEMTSGMERFILSQAIRSALVNITNLPKANFIAIDEGFGVLDPENMQSVYLLFDHLKQKVDFLLCISHIESMRDAVENAITIEKVDGFSRILA